MSPLGPAIRSGFLVPCGAARPLAAALLVASSLGACRPPPPPAPRDPHVRRILVVAPHPDDETIVVSAPLMAAARDPRSEATVVLITNGEGNSKMILEGPRDRAVDFLRVARLRIAEFRAAMRHLGVPRERTGLLGYPDGQLEYLWRLQHNALCLRFMPVCSVFLREGLLGEVHGVGRSRLAFTGERLIQDLVRVLARVQPDEVYFPAAADSHKDHAAAHRFVRAALERHAAARPMALYTYLVHYDDAHDTLDRLTPAQRARSLTGSRDYPFHVGWPGDPARGLPGAVPTSACLPNPYTGYAHANGRDDHLDLPALPDPAVVHYLAPEALARKRDALMAYATQVAYAPRYLTSFLTTTEYFWRDTWDPRSRRIVSRPGPTTEIGTVPATGRLGCVQRWATPARP